MPTADPAAPPEGRRAEPRPERRRGRSRLGRWLRWLLIAAVAAVTLVVAVIAVCWPLTPSVADLPQRVDAVLDAHHCPDLPALPSPDRVGEAVVAVENSRFYSDHGIDVIGAARAAFDFLRGQDTGGATIEQQLAKLLYGGSWPGPLVKLEQAELAIKIATDYSKPTILRMYLSATYYGNGYYGIVAAARGYFGVTPSRLSWGQAAMLAGMEQAPTTYDPRRHFGLARDREQVVLQRLVDTGVLTEAEARAAYAAPLHLRP